MTDKLNYSTDDAGAATSINPDQKPLPIGLEEATSYLEKYFKSEDPFLYSAFKDGDIHLLKDRFDAITFINTLMVITVDGIRSDNETLSDEDSIVLDRILDSMLSMTKIIKSMNTDKTTINCAVKSLNYCLNTYKKYYKKYDRSKKVSE